MKNDPIFSIVCNEPEGDIERHVYKMDITPENMWTFWNKSKNFKHLFGHELRNDFNKFAETIISGDKPENIEANGLFWRVDNFVGIFYMTEISSFDAQIHYTFFDRRHRGRIYLAKAMIKHVFDKYGLHRLSAEIPLFTVKKDLNEPAMNQSTLKFIQNIGMREEGRKREAAFYDDQWFDVQCFGILKEDTDKWVLNTRTSEEVVLA